MTATPYAITMWDFSWLERRWPGAGFEDWDLALDELTERGYNAVRIDAYPHLVAEDPDATWELTPVWNQQDWGSPAAVSVRVLPELLEFVAKAKARGVGVALSTWFRRDRTDVRMKIRTPERHGEIWVEVLRHLEAAGLLDAILFVDLNNEFAIEMWSPFLYTGEFGLPSGRWGFPRREEFATEWMRRATDAVREYYPDIEYTFSQVIDDEDLSLQDVSALDILEPHVWMVVPGVTDFYDNVGYSANPFSPMGYENLVHRGKATFEAHREEYLEALFATIDRVADWSRSVGRYLVTTECWSIVDYKDWPGLDWDWVLEVNELAVERAASTGRWAGIGTSNFVAPQFVGVWREVEYHRRLTQLIRSSSLEELRTYR